MNQQLWLVICFLLYNKFYDDLNWCLKRDKIFMIKEMVTVLTSD